MVRTAWLAVILRRAHWVCVPATRLGSIRVLVGFIAAGVVAVGLLAGPAHASERILSFQSRIQVQPDASLEVTETLRVRAEGNRIKRGIFREFPTVYVDRRGNRSTLDFRLLSVRRDGATEPYHTEQRSNGVAIYAGRKEVFLKPGEYTYEIAYRVQGELGLFGEHDELYWNVTGNGWEFPIDAASALVTLPPGVPPDQIQLEAYTGTQGARGGAYQARLEQGVARFVATAPLAAREGLTIVVMWPKGFISPPPASALAVAPPPSAAAERAVYVPPRPTGHQPLEVAATGLAVLVSYYLLIWGLVGRDPESGVVMPRYRPPQGESPASMRYVLRMAYDDRCFAAAVLSLAIKGHLTIHRGQSGLFSTGTYTLRRRTGSTSPLSPDEEILLRKVFAAGDALDLTNSNHSVVSVAKRAHERDLKKRYAYSFFRINNGWHLLGVMFSILVAICATFVQTAHGFDALWFFGTPAGQATLAAVAVGFVANGAFGRLLKAPTVRGRKLLDDIEGFRQYLDVAEGDEIKLAGAPRKTPSLFEAYLPFALALGLEQKWAEGFATVFATQAPNHVPDWYAGERWNADRFSASFGRSFEAAVSSASTPPGSSSGGDGGGSSGGGGGGGGGGGW